MKKISKKYLALLASVAVLLTVSVGSTVAYLVDKADEVVNTFTPTCLATNVVEDFKKDEATGVVTKSSIKIQNDGNIDAYVRVFVTGNWLNDNDEVVAPWKGTLNLNSTDWASETVNGLTYYYYTKRLPPSPDGSGDLTSNLLVTPITQTDGPTGAHLVINVIHQSIQADPSSTVQNVWGVTITETKNTDGTITYTLTP